MIVTRAARTSRRLIAVLVSTQLPLAAAGCAGGSATTSAPAAAVAPRDEVPSGGQAADQPAPGGAAPGAGGGIERPIPYPVEPSAAFLNAVDAGTRTRAGKPGPAYWQQWAEYEIEARVDTDAQHVEGTTRIRYYNRSPDRLPAIVLKLYQNFHAPGAPRLEAAELTGGMEIRRVAVDGAEAGAGTGMNPRYRVSGTLLSVRPRRPISPGDTVEIAVGWGFDLPRDGASGRMGWNADNLVYLAYWYPQLAVYDDVNGWHTDPFMGRAEFYAGFGDYDVTLDVPAGWVVMGTGTLMNAAEVLPKPVLERMHHAETSDTVIHVLTPADFGPGRATRDGASGRLRWRFQAEHVRDVAYSITRASSWDATRTPVGDRDGDGEADYARVDAFYRESAPRWQQAAAYARHAIDFLSRFTAFPYPWPHMTAVEGGGIIGGGMEYPMMTLIGDYTDRGDSALYYVIAHELAHMWVPMIVSTDETRWAWMDEGTTSFNENQARNEFFPGRDHTFSERDGYIRAALSGNDDSMMRWTDWTYPNAWGVDAYSKPATTLMTLWGLLGDSIFVPAYRDYIRTWAWKHPKPWDFFNHFNEAAGEDLSWFWRSWYYEHWVLDQAVAEVRSEGNGTVIVIEDRGQVPMPVRILITRENGDVDRREVPVDVWLAGARRTAITVPPGAEVVRVEIDADQAFPDVDRENNVWTR